MDPKAKRKFFIVVGFMMFLSLGMIAGGLFSWIDEHSGTAGTAHVTHCTSHYFGKRAGGSISCDATWVYNGRTVTGYVENAMAHDLGKDISVRIHGTSHVTKQSYWVPLGLGLGGLLCLGVFGWITVLAARRPTAPAGSDQT